MKSRSFKIAIIIVAGIGILYAFYIISYYSHCVEPEFCTSPINIDGKLDEADWELKKNEFYHTYNPKFKTSDFSRFQFLRDDDNLYFGLQLNLDSTLTGWEGVVFVLNDSSDFRIQIEIEFDSKTSRKKKQRGPDFEFELKGKNGTIEQEAKFDDYDNTPSFFKNIKMQQTFANNKWNIELSIPIEIMVEEKDEYIAFNMDMYGVSSKDSRLHFSLDYPINLSFFFNKYVVIKNLNR